MKYKTQLTINADKLDITDPCYKKDVWCRTSVPIVPGQYTAEVWYDDDNGHRDIRALLIYRSDSLYAKGDIDERALSFCSEYIDDIGVDSGTAGIYVNKPDYDDETWYAIADYFYGKNNNGLSNKFYVATTQDNPTQCVGITVSTGDDGEFPLYGMLDEDGNTTGYIVYFD